MIRSYPLNEQEVRLIAAYRKLANEHRDMLLTHATKLAEPQTAEIPSAPNVRILSLTGS